MRNKDLYSVLRRCLDERQDQNAQFEIPGQEPRFFDVRAVHLSGKDKEASALAVLHDITALQRAEAVRRDFVANVSHELRTPLGAITGSVETLLDGALQDEKAAKEFLEIIHNNAQQLSELIDQLLDLAKIESQGLDWKWEQVNLCKIVQESRMVFQLRLAAKRIEFESNVPEDMNVRADKNRLRQVLNNLLDNAIKFNREAGRIVVSAAANERAVEVSVEDTGKGIPAESLSRVFERFYRVEKDRNRQAESGAGLGLSIVRHIVEKHGGRVWVESQLERGSTFKFTLPSAASV